MQHFVHAKVFAFRKPTKAPPLPRLVGSLDTRRGLWSAGAANPVVGNIKDLLVEEVAAEEEELLGAPVQEDQGAMQVPPQL